MTKIGQVNLSQKVIFEYVFLDSRNIFPGERILSEEEVDDIIAQADVDNDGDIDYEEFVKMLTII